MLFVPLSYDSTRDYHINIVHEIVAFPGASVVQHRVITTVQRGKCQCWQQITNTEQATRGSLGSARAGHASVVERTKMHDTRAALGYHDTMISVPLHALLKRWRPDFQLYFIQYNYCLLTLVHATVVLTGVTDLYASWGHTPSNTRD